MADVIKSGAEAILYIGRQLDPKFNLDDINRRHYYEKAFYIFSGNPRALALGVNPDKGLLHIGHKGVGKTMLMMVMQRLFKDTPRRFKWVTALELKDLLDEYKLSEIKEMYGKGCHCDLYIDDIGMGQSEQNRYGNVTNIIAEILFERDELYVKEHFRTHLSSNLPTTVPKTAAPTQLSIERMYGDRTLDRMAQMTNLFHWEHTNSLRRHPL